MSEKRRNISIDWVQAAAGALTAVTSAVLLSTVGVAGTLIGAAVGSVAASVGNAVYGHYLALSKERVASTKVVSTARVRQAGARLGEAGATAELGGHREHVQLDRARQAVREAHEDAEHPERLARVSWREAVSGLPWKRIGAVAGGIFVLAMGVILAFELITGRAVSTYTGGTEKDHARTSIPGLGGSDGADRDREPTGEPGRRTTGDDGPKPAGPASSHVPDGGRVEVEPGTGATPAPQATRSPTSTASPSPSATPTSPTPTPSPSAPAPSGSPAP